MIGGRFRNEGDALRRRPERGRAGARSAGRRGRVRAADAARRAGAWRLLPALGAAAATAWFAGFVPAVARGEVPVFVVPWVPALGIDFAFRLDGLALAFALLICGIGAMVFLYAATYFRSDRRLGSLLLTLVAFAVSMLGLVTADDAITLFVFWEGTTITSWLLVGFDHERASARAAALQALLVTGLGGLALLAGLLVMGGMAGTYRLSEMNAMGEMFRASPLYPAIFWLVILACFTKSAQFPFQFWLPNAMAAPTPVSAYLHSATMVKAGRLPARAAHPGARRHRALDLGAGAGRRLHHAPRLGLGDAADRPEADARLHHGDGARA